MKIDHDKDIIVSGWSDLCDRLYDDSWKEDLGRFRTDYAFRGVSDKDYLLENRFTRVCGNQPHLEYHLLRNFRKYALINQLKDPAQLSSDWRVLTLGQHYSLPTRLMDWTYSPFVAVHFATADIGKYDRDGVIWKADFRRINRLLPQPLKTVLESVGANTFTVEMLEEALPHLKDFDNLSAEGLVLFFEPPSFDARIVNQFAIFSVMSKPTATLHIWLKDHPDLYRRIVIPKALKWEIRDKLDQANITERMLFPGLDGLATWLSRHYSPKG